ncbi:MAG TPA: hypothetical protein VFI80_07745 [Burkholderiales bacterium]|nr:hypothetical protein [Burkholderiales bacterium]
MTSMTWPGSVRSGTADEGTRQFWLRYARYGLALGALIAFLEFAYYDPLISSRGQLGVGLLFSMLLTWSGEGLLLALTVGLFERWAAPRPLEAWHLALAVLTGSIVGVLVWQLFMQSVMRERLGILLLRDYVNQPVEFAPIALYNIWMMLFCGGLAAALHLSRQRHVRTLAILRAAELAREASQRKLAQERLAAVRASVDPDFLFHTLTRLEQEYESNPAGADRLLEELIVFLRGAVADVRAASAPANPKEQSI